MSVLVLDAKDKRILFELDLNGREFISNIAKKVGLSKEVVNYRIKRLQQNDVIKGFGAVIDPSKIGYRIYRIFIKYRDLSPETEQKLLKHLKNHPNVGWVVTYEGFYDLVILFWAKDIFSFREMCDGLFTEYGKYFQNIVTTVILNIYHFKHNFLFDSNDYNQIVIGGKVDSIELDEIDNEILKILAEDCRNTTLNIGSKLNLPPNTVKYRIKRLIDNKVIVAFKTKIDVSTLGYQHYKVFLSLHQLTEKVRKDIIGFLKINPNVVYVTDALGHADLEFEAHVKNVKDIHFLIRSIKAQFPETIKDSNATLVYKEHRINYLPSTNGKNKPLK
ncbi:MAG: Lrp/AsnC family transcriptional regulator [Nanoarchaeota archaeon]|nr:Lrp/AsnC family transcriptional regulator [Nanoarchaeota archaeon]MBU1632809.1 Lrp/AsnC family transcriptional regulator [Nanoarchaeota archaeon]MBU1876498.1 Lrp/AsnC family transcriptional regulator [Nanoarchaeota archaeon]